jgi:hypothetical protein
MALDSTLFNKLEAQWRRLHPPLLDALQPGLSPDDIAEKMEPTGLALPPELQTWWGWHNGVSPNLDAYFTPACQLLSLDDAIEIARIRREVAIDVVATSRSGDPAEFWPPTYLPVFAWADWPIATDCTIQTPSSPLFCVDAMNRFGNRALVAPSVGDAIHAGSRCMRPATTSATRATTTGSRRASPKTSRR